MKSLFWLTSIIFFSINSYSQVETEVYRQFAKSYILKHLPPNINSDTIITIIVQKKPSEWEELNYYSPTRLKDKYKKIEIETLEDFAIKKKEPFESEYFNVPGLELRIFEEDSLPSWEEIYDTYPNAILHYYRFTKIGFNKEKTQAIFYYGYVFGGLGGGGYLVYNKKRKKWKFKEYIPVWAA